MGKKNKRKPVVPQTVPKKPTTNSPLMGGRKIDFYWIALGLVIIIVSLIRFRLIGIPLERDEGEYAYIGKLILDGTPPYTDAYNMKLPGTYYMYALLMGILGKTVNGVHLGLWVVNTTTIIFLFLSFRKLFNKAVGFFSASVFAIMSLSPGVFGFAAHATQFVCLFAAISLFFLARYYEKRKWLPAFLTGLMFGLAFLMKQQAVFFLIFGGIAVILPFVLEKPFKIKPFFLNGLINSAGGVLPYLLTVLVLKMSGAFDKFWFWTVQYATTYSSRLTLKDGIGNFKTTFTPIWKEFIFFCLLFLAGIILTFLTKYTMRQKINAILFTVCAFLTACPGLFFREHYYISFLPGLALLAGISMDYLTSLTSRLVKTKYLTVLPIAAFFIPFGLAISKNKYYYLEGEPVELCKMIYGINPFVQSQELASYLKDHTDKKDKIAVLGSEPQIYFYADRHAASGYVYTYSLMEKQKYNVQMQKEMIAELEKNKPKYIVFCQIYFSWLRKAESPNLIFEWFDDYVKKNYDYTGVVDIVSPDETYFKWEKDLLNYQTKGENLMLVFKRKQGL